MSAPRMKPQDLRDLLGIPFTDEQLAEILQYHVVQGAVGYSTTLSNDLKLPTLAGEELTITIDEEG